MKHSLLIIMCVLVLFVTLAAGLMDDNGRAGFTGSPGEITCNTTNCHNSFVLNSGGGSISATSNMINWAYEPLTNYTINIKVAKTGVQLFGFGVEILNGLNNNAGTLVITDAARTQFKSRSVGGIIRKNIVHQLNGGSSQDSVLFSFDWIAPDTSSGILTMYFIGNATNSSGSPSGDYIYNSSQTITPSGVNAVENLVATNPFSVFPNPATSTIRLHFYLPKNEIVEVKLYDMQYSFVRQLMKHYHHAGENNVSISLPADCKSGLYLICIESESGRESRKLMIN